MAARKKYIGYPESQFELLGSTVQALFRCTRSCSFMQPPHHASPREHACTHQGLSHHRNPNDPHPARKRVPRQYPSQGHANAYSEGRERDQRQSHAKFLCTPGEEQKGRHRGRRACEKYERVNGYIDLLKEGVSGEMWIDMRTNEGDPDDQFCGVPMRTA